jgi:hypothetical protein
MSRSPSPFLCLTGLSYLLPMYVAYANGHYWTSGASLFLALTSVGFHWTHREDILAVDRLAILQYFACSIYQSRGWSAVSTSISVAYCLVAYFLGQTYSIMCFDPNPNVQSLFHAMIHLSTATCAVLAVA